VKSLDTIQGLLLKTVRWVYEEQATTVQKDETLRDSTLNSAILKWNRSWAHLYPWRAPTSDHDPATIGWVVSWWRTCYVLKSRVEKLGRGPWPLHTEIVPSASAGRQFRHS